MIDSVASSLALLLIAAASIGVGGLVLRRCGFKFDNPIESGVWSLALGLVVASAAITVLGVMGILYKSVIGVLTCVGAFIGCGEIVRLYLGWRAPKLLDEQSLSDEVAPTSRSALAGRWPLFALSLAVVACGAAFVSALAPPTAGDALCYHLELPKEFLRQHKLSLIPFSDNATFPLFVEMLYLWGLALEGPVAAQLVHWLLGLLLGAGTVLLAIPLLGRNWAWVAGSLVVLIPAVSNQMSVPLNDVALASFSTLALVAWHRGLHENPFRWFVISGVMIGAALATKYVAWLLIAAHAVAIAWTLYRHPIRRATVLRGTAIALGVAVLLSGFWYARAAWHRGNPVYPFRLSAAGARSATNPNRDKTPLGWSPQDVLSAPWQVTMYPQRFGGRGHRFGPLFLAALPGLLIARRLRGMSTLLIVALCYWLLWYGLRQNTRFLLPIVPLLAIGVTWVLVELTRMPRPARLLTQGAIGAILIGYAAGPLWHARRYLPVALGIESRDAFLQRSEPTFAAASLANRLVGDQARVLSQDYRGLYFEGQVTREVVYRRCSEYQRSIHEPSELSDRLRREGFTHLLLAESTGDEGIRFDPTLSRLVDQELAAVGNQSLVCLTEYEFEDSDGALRRYRLMMLR